MEFPYRIPMRFQEHTAGLNILLRSRRRDQTEKMPLPLDYILVLVPIYDFSKSFFHLLPIFFFFLIFYIICCQVIFTISGFEVLPKKY